MFENEDYCESEFNQLIDCVSYDPEGKVSDLIRELQKIKERYEGATIIQDGYPEDGRYCVVHYVRKTPEEIEEYKKEQEAKEQEKRRREENQRKGDLMIMRNLAKKHNIRIEFPEN